MTNSNPGMRAAKNLKQGARGITTPARILGGAAKTANKIGNLLKPKKKPMMAPAIPSMAKGGKLTAGKRPTAKAKAADRRFDKTEAKYPDSKFPPKKGK